MLDNRAGFLLVDVMVAATVLALMVGATGGLLSARRACLDRAQRRHQVSGCFDESIARMAADHQLSHGICDGLRWSVEGGGAETVWSGSGRHIERTSFAIAAR